VIGRPSCGAPREEEYATHTRAMMHDPPCRHRRLGPVADHWLDHRDL
jgi:hypothetical protein